MINDLIDAGSDLTQLLIVIAVGGIAFGALFIISDQIVQNSGYAPLQTTYQMTKPIVTTVTEIQDTGDTVKAILTLVGLCGGGYLAIWIVKNIDFSDFM